MRRVSLPPSRTPRVELFVREGCHLCEQAEAVVAAVCGQLGEAYALVDVDEDEDRATEARIDVDELPVTFVDGRQHDFWRVDPVRLRTALAG
ncbi:glutaredoxin family protein [Nocardioides zeae]|uniref:Glutaredoxin family protein n=1 Tax=Nocardioides imazamoxiresistens TaxID=3231893 RepID=A0ABU3PZX2_9ACTN|nr:glutaredoxin family protein [Nocardioides zeae]MDT9594800.1 glutaredoxin family protein [Nocardioides zeae]